MKRWQCTICNSANECYGHFTNDKSKTSSKNNSNHTKLFTTITWVRNKFFMYFPVVSFFFLFLSLSFLLCLHYPIQFWSTRFRINYQHEYLFMQQDNKLANFLHTNVNERVFLISDNCSENAIHSLMHSIEGVKVEGKGRSI